MRLPCLAAAFGLWALPALAQATLTGSEVAGLVSGRTVQGSMADSGAYSEFYDADGTIRGDGYTGRWTIEGDAMCFAYGADPATCFGVSAEGEALNWIAEGEVVGTGTLVDGNPNGF